MTKTKSELIREIEYWTAAVQDDLNTLKKHTDLFYTEGKPTPNKIEDLDPCDVYVAHYMVREIKMDLEVHQTALNHAVLDLKEYEETTGFWKKIIDVIVKR